MPAKKTVRSSSPKKRAPVRRRQPASGMDHVPAVMAQMEPPMPDPKPIQDPAPEPQPGMPGPATGCSSCNHLPMSPMSAVGVLAVAGVALSAVLLASSFVISPASFSAQAFDLFGLLETLASR